MNRRHTHSRKLFLLCGALLLLKTPHLLAQPSPAAIAAFNSYCASVESRLARQHRSPSAFLAPASSNSTSAEIRLRHGDLLIQQLTPPNPELRGALLHHWRGTAFAPGATAADFEHLLEDFNAYPQNFAPQVLTAHLLARNGNRMQAAMRIRQHHVITVVMDTTYDITANQLDPRHRFTLSHSAHIAEIASPGTPSEHPLSPAEEHGFLYRLNTYWSFEQRDGGLYLQIEAVSLTRSIPSGLGWIIAPYIESIPRESLQFTLLSARNALHKTSTVTPR
jgi:hypothetical protein